MREVYGRGAALVRVRLSVAMTSDPTPLSEAPPVPAPGARIHRRLSVLVVEDWLLAGWVALATPALFRVQGGAGPFDSGAPLDGTLRLLAVLGALICLAARRPKTETGDLGASLLQRGAAGPLCGGLLLVGISGFTALEVPSGLALALVLAVAVAMVAVHLAGPPFPVVARRALVTPFVMVAGGLFWSLIAAVIGEPGGTTAEAVVADPQAALAGVAFLLAFSAVYYAMLVYAPRQVAERDGGVVTWLLRYALFVAGVVAGLAWPRLFGA